MKIWLINHYAVPPRYYPLARQANFAKYMMKKGHQVRIFAASTVHNSTENLIKDGKPYHEIEDDGIPYTLIRCGDYQGNGFRRMVNMCEFAVKLPGICKRYERPDVIVSTSVPPTSCAMGIWLARRYHCKGIAEIADLWPETLVAYGFVSPRSPITLALRCLEKWIYTKADSVVFFEDGEYDYIIEQGWDRTIPRSKVFCISNGVDLEAFESSRQAYVTDDEDLKNRDFFKVVYTGSIRSVNHLGLLLDAAKEVRNPRIRFLIWGTGDELELLTRRVREEGIANVVFKGVVEKKFIPYITSHADLNIVHNRSMDLFRFGISFNKIFDYMAAGKPILCDFSCPYNPVVMTGSGVDVKNPDPLRIAKAIEEMSEMHPDEYHHYCQNALAAAKEYDFKRLTEKLIDVIQGNAKPIGSGR